MRIKHTIIVLLAVVSLTCGAATLQAKNQATTSGQVLELHSTKICIVEAEHGRVHAYISPGLNLKVGNHVVLELDQDDPSYGTVVRTIE